MRRKPCEHDIVYSGQTNLSGHFAYICRRCGQCGWDERYDIAAVSAPDYYDARVAHGWAAPRPVALSSADAVPPALLVLIVVLGMACYLVWKGF